MLLHSAAGMHNHEYSHSTLPARPRSDFMPRRSPLNRSSFSKPGPEISTTQEAPIPAVLTRRSRALSEYIPRKLEHQQLHTVRFQEPEADTMSEDGRSIANSEGSRTAGSGKLRRRSSRPSTVYCLADPPPTVTHKQRLLDIRPKKLLQLRLLSSEGRGKPAFDVRPSTYVAPRIAKRFPRMFKGKDKLGTNDIIIEKSEDYSIPDRSTDEADSDVEGSSNKDIIAVICQMPKVEGRLQGHAEIILADGSKWLASPLENGSYDIIKFDESGTPVTTVRWKMWNKKGSAQNISDPPNKDTKLKFSIINPDSRRHPILASITETKLDIPIHYIPVSSSSTETTKAPVRGVSSELDDEDGETDEVIELPPQLLDESMRTLIQVTGIWVYFRQGWSPYFKYNDDMAPGRNRSSSVSALNGPRSTTPESTLEAIGNRICNIAKATASVIPSSPHESVASPRRARATSAGAAFMQRAASRKINTIARDGEEENIARLSENSEGENIARLSEKSEGEDMAQRPESNENHDVETNATKRASAPPSLGLNIPGGFPQSLNGSVTPGNSEPRTSTHQSKPPAVVSPPPAATTSHQRAKSAHMVSSTSRQNTGGTVDGRSEHSRPNRKSRWRSILNIFCRRTPSNSS